MRRTFLSMTVSLTTAAAVACLAAACLVAPTGCAEHYRIDPKTGKRVKISAKEYRELKKNDAPRYERTQW